MTGFTHDGDGLRRQTVTAAGTTNFIWDGQDVLLETDGNGTTQVTYTQTPDVYGSMVSQRRDSTTTFYHHDALGSTLALTNASETVTDTYRFYAFGETLISSGSTTNPFQYVGNLGYYNEAALSLQYLRARYYQPGTGRLISVDPVGISLAPMGLPTGYLYVSNNPVNIVDPTGLWDMNYVHYEKTRYWARQVNVKRGKYWWKPTQQEANKMGEGSRQVDELVPTWNPWKVSNWPWHFDYPPGSGSREKLYQAWRTIAVNWAQSGPWFCGMSAFWFGVALHPLQDKYSHGPATWLEHYYDWYWWAGPKEMDNIWRDTDWRVRQGIRVDPSWRLQNFGRDFRRVFIFFSGRKRHDETKEATQDAVKIWLQSTPCGEITDPPEPSPPTPTPPCSQ